MVRTVQTLLHSQLACNEMQASVWRTEKRQEDGKVEYGKAAGLQSETRVSEGQVD